MIEIGKVLKIEEDKAEVALEASEHCRKCGVCMLDSHGQRTLKVYNTAEAEVGDRVEVSIPKGVVSKCSYFIFIFPIISFLLGYLLLGWLSNNEVVGATGGGIAFILTFYAFWFYDKKLREIKKDTLPYISRVLEHAKIEEK
jgi:positive regulator of sigma E activity